MATANKRFQVRVYRKTGEIYDACETRSGEPDTESVASEIYFATLSAPSLTEAIKKATKQYEALASIIDPCPKRKR